MRKLLQKIARLKVVVVGDLALDHYIWGDSSRLSPEAPVPVVAVDNETYTAGMAAIPALNLRAWNVGVEVCGVLGDDESGGRLRGLLFEAGIRHDDGFVVPGLRSIVKTRVMSRDQHICRVDREDPPSAYAVGWKRQIDALRAKIESADAVILSDYSKGVITEEYIQKIQLAARQTGIPVSLDPKPRRPLRFHDLDLITPNRSESLELAGIGQDWYDRFPADEVCLRIWEKYRPRNLVITMDSEGMLLSREGRVVKRIPCYSKDVFDVSGAGDTSIAALTAAMACGEDVEAAIHFANTAAGVVVGKRGVAVASPDEILAHWVAHE